MNRIFEACIEIIYWIFFFLGPVILFAGIGLILYFSYQAPEWLMWVLSGLGVITGVWVAEKIRRKYGTSRFAAIKYETPDIWPVEEFPDTKNKQVIGQNKSEKQ